MPHRNPSKRVSKTSPEEHSDGSDNVFDDAGAETKQRLNGGLQRLLSTESDIILPRHPQPKEKKPKQSFLKLRSNNRKPKPGRFLSSPSMRRVMIDARTLGGGGLGGGGGGGSSGGSGAGLGLDSDCYGHSSLSSSDVKYYWTDTDEENVQPVIPTWMHEANEVRNAIIVKATLQCLVN